MKYRVTFIDVGNCEIYTVEVEDSSWSRAIGAAMHQIPDFGAYREVDQDTVSVKVELIK